MSNNLKWIRSWREKTGNFYCRGCGCYLNSTKSNHHYYCSPCYPEALKAKKRLKKNMQMYSELSETLDKVTDRIYGLKRQITKDLTYLDTELKKYESKGPWNSEDIRTRNQGRERPPEKSND